MKGQATIARRPPGRGAAGALTVLVAEDNEISRKLTVRLLEKMGHSVVAVADGAGAVAALGDQRFDIVLMDVQMPVMDGFEAAGLIRKVEEGTGRHIPIIALTAHGMSGYRERCLAAGMDDYICKPMRAGDIAAAVARQMSAPRNETPPPPAADAPAVDMTELLKLVGPDMAFLDEVVNDFLADCEKTRAALHGALAEGDGAGLVRGGHGLKGSLAHLGARAAMASAEALERAGKEGRLAEAPAALAELERSMEPVVVYLKSRGWEKRP